MRQSKRPKMKHERHLNPEQEKVGTDVQTQTPAETAPQALTRTPLCIAIDSEGGGIRLLQLMPGGFDDPLDIKLVTSNVNNPEQYHEALSYVWRTGIASQKALLDGVPVAVTPNLDCALRHLRFKVTSRTLWIDALSINQNDVHERNGQVQMMGNIYSSAIGVLGWLGPVDQTDLHLNALECTARCDTVQLRKFEPSGSHTIQLCMQRCCTPKRTR